MLERIHSLASLKADFAFETTLASRTFFNWMQKLQKQGYKLYLVFLWLENPNLAISRVKERVKSGGHFVSEETISRRYKAGIKNFFTLYKPIVDYWQLYDNSNLKKFPLIASGTKDNILTEKEIIWQYLLEKYGE